MEDRFYNTDSIELNGKKYCPYCGEELKQYGELKHGYEIKYYNCTCADAEKAYKINEEIQKLKWSLPAPKYRVAEALVKW